MTAKKKDLISEIPMASKAFGGAANPGKFDFKVDGGHNPTITILLGGHQEFYSEPGALTARDEHVKMSSVLRSGNGRNILSGLFNSVMRTLGGESLFLNKYKNTSEEKGKLSFGSGLEGSITPINVNASGHSIVARKGSMVAAMGSPSFMLGARLKPTLFGVITGNLIMQNIQSGSYVFLHAPGHVEVKELKEGESYRIDPKHLLAASSTVKLKMRLAGGALTTLVGGEDIFQVKAVGPGKVWKTSQPFPK